MEKMWKMHTVNNKLKKGSIEELSPLSAQTQSVIIIIITKIIIMIIIIILIIIISHVQ